MSTEILKQKISIGWGSRDVTSSGKASLWGQFHLRISDKIHDPLMTTALAIESEDRKEQAILVSLDAVGVQKEVLDGCRESLNNKLPDFDSKKLVINATHTHSAPEQPGSFLFDPSPKLGDDVLTRDEYGKQLIDGIVAAAIEAWESRKPGLVSWGRGHAVVGFNRRVSYFDGTTVMYGKTDRPEFSHMEGHEDHGVELLFTYDIEQNLTGMIVNVPCPSQCTESTWFVSADYWHETRQEIRKRHGEKIYILPQASAAGDMAPCTLINQDADARMLKLKGYGDEYNPARRIDIADKIAAVVDEVLPLVAQDVRGEVEFAHVVMQVDLPVRIATEEDLRIAQSEVVKWQATLEELKDADPISIEYSGAFRHVSFNQHVVDLYYSQKVEKDTLPVELHALRIGDIGMVTNRFEYYLDFGERIKARSNALQTFVVQLAGGGFYLPTVRSLKGGSYGASIASTPIGPEGGQIIVEKSVAAINQMFSGGE